MKLSSHFSASASASETLNGALPKLSSNHKPSTNAVSATAASRSQGPVRRAAVARTTATDAFAASFRR